MHGILLSIRDKIHALPLVPSSEWLQKPGRRVERVHSSLPEGVYSARNKHISHPTLSHSPHGILLVPGHDIYVAVTVFVIFRIAWLRAGFWSADGWRLIREKFHFHLMKVKVCATCTSSPTPRWSWRYLAWRVGSGGSGPPN